MSARTRTSAVAPARRRPPVLFVLLALALSGAFVSARPAEAVKRRAFATSATGNGNLNSWPEADGLFALAAADRICQNLAEAADLDNFGAFRAWMSTAATDAYCHIQGRTGKKGVGCSGSPQPAGPWFQVNSANFTGTLDELTGPERVIFRGVLQDETGAFLVDTEPNAYWTGTTRTGEVSPDNCSSWVVGASGATGLIGEALASAERWTERIATGCQSERRLLCLETGTSEPPAPTPWAPAALVFVTSVLGSGNLSSWPQATGGVGIVAGDEICATLAAEASLPSPESFVAFLSDSHFDAADRLTLDGVRYRRVDHYQVADNKADLLDGTNDNSLHVDERGRYASAEWNVFTGSSANGTLLDLPCGDWTQASQVGNVRAGSASTLRSGVWAAGVGTACAGARLYCFSNVVTLFWDAFEITGDASRWSSTSP